MTKIYYTFEDGWHCFRNHKKGYEKIDYAFFGEYNEAIKQFKIHYRNRVKKFEIINQITAA